MMLAYFRGLKKNRFSLSESVHVIYDISEVYVSGYLLLLPLVYLGYYISQYHNHLLQCGVNRSRLRRYPANGVITFQDSHGIAFYFGIDLSECALLKYYRAQNTELLTPCVCQHNHALRYLLGLEFQRQDTLANGAVDCDCRWKLGAETPGCPPIADTNLQNLYSK